METLHERMTARYASGDLPWEDTLPPPEVVAWVDAAAAGRALDLGCGTGRAARYLAARGWQVDGIDFVARAIELAREHSAEFPTITYHHASVADLHFLTPSYDFAVDVGCGHALSDDLLPSYVAELARLLRLGATFLLFGKLSGDSDETGFDEPTLHTLMSPHFTLAKQERGITTMPDESWESVWYWWEKT